MATAPINRAPQVSIVGPSEITPGFDSTFWATATDLDGDDLSIQFEIFDADGFVVVASAANQIAFEPTNYEDYFARLTVTDGRATVTVEHDISVTPLRVQGNVLNIFGTAGDDRILIKPAPGSSASGVSTTIAGQKFTATGSFDQVRVFALAGDDIVKISNSKKFDVSFEAQGGDGDDSLTGGRQDDLLLGQGGNDRIRGGAGNDMLAGGAGADEVDGGSGDDTIAGGLFNGTDDLSIDRLLGKSGSGPILRGPGDQLIGFRSGTDSLAD